MVQLRDPLLPLFGSGGLHGVADRRGAGCMPQVAQGYVGSVSAPGAVRATPDERHGRACEQRQRARPAGSGASRRRARRAVTAEREPDCRIGTRMRCGAGTGPGCQSCTARAVYGVQRTNYDQGARATAAGPALPSAVLASVSLRGANLSHLCYKSFSRENRGSGLENMLLGLIAASRVHVRVPRNGRSRQGVECLTVAGLTARSTILQHSSGSHWRTGCGPSTAPRHRKRRMKAMMRGRSI